MKLLAQYLLFALALFFGAELVVQGQVTIPYTFSSNTTIRSSEVNSNFSTLGSNALNRTGGTVTGTLSSSGGGLSGSWSGSPTFSGNPTFSGTPVITNGTLTINGLAYTFPSSQSANYFLQTNGSGTLSWAAATNTLLDGSNHTDTLSGSVVRGSVIVGNSTPKWSALAIGTSGKVLRSDGTDASWSYPSLSSQSGSFSATSATDYYLVSATATVSLPACNSGATGKWFHIKNTGTGTITLDGNASETIDGATTYSFSQQYAAISLVCNGSGAWSIF